MEIKFLAVVTNIEYPKLVTCSKEFDSEKEALEWGHSILTLGGRLAVCKLKQLIYVGSI